MNTMEFWVSAGLGFALGMVASVVATIYTNKRYSAEGKIERHIMKIIKAALKECGGPEAIGFDTKKFKDSIIVWQDHVNLLLQIIDKSPDAVHKIDPRMFAIYKYLNQYNQSEMEAYKKFCDAFVRGFLKRFCNKDKEVYKLFAVAVNKH